MTKSVKATPVTPANTSKRAIARLKVRQAKWGSVEPRWSQESRWNQRWNAETHSWVK